MPTATGEAGDKDGKDERSRWVGVYIGVLAVLLAICNVGGANATKDATHSNIAAANTWAFFQAKNIRRNAIGLAADDLELMLAAQPAVPDGVKKRFEEKIQQKFTRSSSGSVSSAASSSTRAWNSRCESSRLSRFSAGSVRTRVAIAPFSIGSALRGVSIP